MKKEKSKDEYYFAGETRTGNAIVRVYRPILTEEERARREEEIKKATVKFMKAVMQQKQKN